VRKNTFFGSKSYAFYKKIKSPKRRMGKNSDWFTFSVMSERELRNFAAKNDSPYLVSVACNRIT